MEQNAIVIEKSKDRATVRVLRESACAGCHKMGSGSAPCRECRLFDTDPALQVTAIDRAGAEVGDRVVLQSPSGRILGWAALTFFLPTVLAITAAILLQNAFSTVLYSVLGFLLTLAVSFILIRLTLERRARRAPEPQIVRIISR